MISNLVRTRITSRSSNYLEADSPATDVGDTNVSLDTWVAVGGGHTLNRLAAACSGLGAGLMGKRKGL